MFIFYDTETTGLDTEFDQILQFGAILTDEKFNKIESFEIRCQLLPWVVPSPEALLVTNTPTSALQDKSLPTFYAMMSEVYDKLTSWGPAVFIGYNSISFDEIFLHRAFWQSLYPPYLTVTNGNRRCDLLPMLQATHYFFPECLAWPRKENGNISFRLDQIAPANGFDHSKAHDALNDVEATLFIAKKLSHRQPDFWQTLLSRSRKKAISEILSTNDPVLVFNNYRGKSAAWFGQAIPNKGFSSPTTLFNLNNDWQELSSLNVFDSSKREDLWKKSLPIAHNKAPIIFPEREAKSLFGLEISDKEKKQSELLRSDLGIQNNILDVIKNTKKEWPAPIALEQRIYDNFVPDADAALGLKFHKSSIEDKLKLLDRFSDKKLERLAFRMLFTTHKDYVPKPYQEKLEELINKRFFPNDNEPTPWRSIKSAIDEIDKLSQEGLYSRESSDEIRNWLATLG